MPGIGQSGATPSPHADSLGVIISLPPELAEQLSASRSRYAAPGAAVVPPHITLVSGRSRGAWDEAAHHVRTVAAAGQPFSISLRGTGTFEPLSSVVFLNVADGAQECAALHGELLQGPVEHLLEFDFHPHLTIAHDLEADQMERAKEDMAEFSADFEVGSIGLYNVIAGGWCLREELALGGARSA